MTTNVSDILSSAEKLKNNLKTKLFKKRRILDLGCGTGLCAEAMLVNFPNEEYYGVDVSEKMLERAEKKNIYTALYTDDIINFLDNNEMLFHAVIAGDVLTYMGNLKPVFRRLTTALKIGGWFCFSVSKNIFDNSDFVYMLNQAAGDRDIRSVNSGKLFPAIRQIPVNL